MKKLLNTLMLAMLFLISKAQPVLYGLTSNGGSNGTISRYEAAGNTLSAAFNFPDIGSRPQGSLLQASDGKFYGMTQGGGTSSLGTFFSFDPVLSVHTKLFDFNGANGSAPQGNLIQANNGKLYGMTTAGGINNLGVIFSFDPVTSAYTKLIEFDELSGNRPGGSLLQASDGKLYGLTYTGGYAGGGFGTIFSLDPATNIFTKLKVFDFVNGAYPVNSLIQTNDGKLYGMTAGGGAIAGIRLGYGVIFSFDPFTSVYTKLKDFDGVNGGVPSGNLLQASDGKLYGITPTGSKADGSTGDYDVLFSFDPATSAYTKLRNFAGVDGDSPYGSLMQASDGKFYGMTTLGGSNGAGVVFSFNPATAAYIKLQDFNGTNGRNPFYGALIELRTITTAALSVTNYCSGAVLPIAYTAKGVYKPGNIFTAQLSNAAGSFTNPVNIGSITSATSGVINTVLPVTAVSGAAYRIRVVSDFPATTGSDNGSNITIDFLPALTLAPFSDVCSTTFAFNLTGGSYPGGIYNGAGVNNNQFNPAAAGAGTFPITYTLIISATCKVDATQSITVRNCKAPVVLYGLTSNYNYNNGTISKYDGVTNTLSASVNFPDIGSNPYGGLLQAGNGKLYGMTNKGGINNAGAIFSFDPATSAYTKLKDLDGINGSSPNGSLLQATNGKLYGMTSYGGIGNLGVLFSFDPVTLVYTKLKDFDISSGTYPFGSLLQASNGKIYGMTIQGGSFDKGVIFSLDPATSVYTKLKDFDGTNGSGPTGSLMQATNHKLYGTTTSGGTGSAGVIFSFDPATFVYAKLKDFPTVFGAHPHGANPTGRLVQTPNGKLYGTAPQGGTAFGVLFSFDPVTSIFTKLKDFEAINNNGYHPNPGLLLASDGKLYGIATDGGIGNFGIVFSFDPVTNAYTRLKDFEGINGGNPFNGLIEPANTITTTALSNNNYCAGSSLTLSYIVSGTYNAGNIFTVQLSDSAGSFTSPVNIGSLASVTNGNINAVLPVNAATGNGYRMRVVSDNPSAASSDNGSNIIINAVPIVTLAPYGDVCISDPSFTLTGGAPAGGTYSGKGVINNQFDPAAVGVGIFTIVYTFKNSAGCTAATKQSISVVKPCVACKASITAGGPTTFCQGGKVTLSASIGAGYLWSNGETTQKITVTTTGSYSVKVIDSKECAAVSMPVAVTVNELPAIPVITASGSTVFCAPGNVTLTAVPASAYLWSNGATTQSITVATSGTYIVTVTNAAGCSASNSITVTAFKCIVYCPVLGSSNSRGFIQKVVTGNGINNNSGWNNGYGNFTNIIGTSSLNSSFLLTISPGFTGAGSKLYTKVWIDWNRNGDFSDAGDLVFAPASASGLDITTRVVIPKTAPGYCTMRIVMSADAGASWCGNFKYGEAEDYTILITSSAARIADLSVTSDNNQFAETNDFRVFPNPAANRLQVQRSTNSFLLSAGSNALLQLTDAGGQILTQTKLQGLQQYIDVSGFSNGIYFLHIKTSNTNIIKKIFIQH